MSVLFEKATANGDYYEVEFEGAVAGILQLEGIWDGAIVTLKGHVPESTVFVTPPNGEGDFIKNTLIGMFFSIGTIRATISKAGVNTNLSGYLQPN
jgi:hypothetical protein